MKIGNIIKAIEAFDNEQALNRQLFLDRQKQYGSHIENHRKFKSVFKAGLYEKCARTIIDMDNGDEIKEDTLRDLSIYANLELSCRRKERNEEVETMPFLWQQ